VTARALVLIVVLSASLLGSGCATTRADSRIVHGTGATIRVTARGTGDTSRVVVTIDPTGHHLHLYDVDLDPESVQGLGLPTTIELTGAWTATGRPVANRAVRHLAYEPLHVTLPVYPDGAVSFRVGARRRAGPVAVRLSYALCSDSYCLPPVRDLTVGLN
jgi:hypothetical protein